ncbi:hypothetical protein [Streptomyces zaomyceticus]|uniref:hypothetical protein n=1 Tax=Streptomyces zaomyceticus TaxID=68286 RepID=UPI002E0F2542|nr:hypothetical protein OG237_06480 [Streptomyces zaomyceticus]
MPDTTSATQDFHWVMTVQTQDGRFNSREAVITAPVGFTASDAFKFVIDQFKADYGSVIVLFYALTPNEL